MYGPIVRIALRYLVGAAVVGSPGLGERLAADPDLVAAGSMALGAAVELYYVWARKRGWTT